jgi:hypothetical protein
MRRAPCGKRAVIGYVGAAAGPASWPGPGTQAKKHSIKRKKALCQKEKTASAFKR